MSETKHSPGPWIISDSPNSGMSNDEAIGIESADGWTVADVYGDAPDLAPYMEANARLIAAAPDLLAALEGLLAECNKEEFIEECPFDAAEAAIKKAYGR